MIKMRHVATFILLLAALCATAQERTVQNRPYTDLRQFHFGVVVGTHMQDIELLNAGPQALPPRLSSLPTRTAGTPASMWVCSASCV